MSTKCPKCHHNFTSPPSEHLPLILPSCLHHLCSSCVNSSHGSVQCFVTTCKERNKQQEESQMVYDYHMLGRKEVSRHRIRQNKMQSFQDSVAQLEPSSLFQMGSGSIRCIKCKNTLSKLSCTTCMTNFCSPCFTATHSTPMLSTHTTVMYQAMDSLLLSSCEEHSRSLEFVSLDDGKLGCSHCALFGELRGKKVVDLEKVGREIKESGMLKNSMDKLSSALGRCQLVKKDLHFHSSDYQSAKDIMEFHLSRCHRMLEVVGEKLMSQLKQREEEHSQTVWKTKKKIEKKIIKLEMLVEAAEWQSDDDRGDKINLVKLLEEMVKIHEDDVLESQDQKSPVVNIDQSVFNVLSDHIALDLAVLPSMVTKNATDIQWSQELSGLLDRFREENKSVVGNKLMKEHFPGMEEVNIMHVESPESFYVMMKKDMQLADNIMKLVEKEWTGGVKGKVKVGDMAVVYMEGRYSRVSVTKIIPGSATVSHPDHGHTSQVPLTSLVSLSANLSLYNCPPLAHHCTLASCGGTLQVGWQAARAVQVFGMGSVCRVAVVGRNASISQSTMMVNVTKEDDDGNTISLLDYLVYHDMATGGTCPEIRAVRNFTQIPPVKAGTEHSVIVVEVNSPRELFVVMEGNGHTEDLTRLLKDLQAEYEEEASNEQMILLPVKGMVCVARFHEDAKFYRVRVTKVLDKIKRMVRVFFVDFGSYRVVEVGDLRRIKQKFLELPAMAVKVGLIDIRPVGKEWSAESSRCVRDYVRKKVLRMVVRKEGKEACKVMMYEWNEKEQDCINIRLVDEGHAKPSKRLLKHPDYEMFLPVRPDPVAGMRTVCRVVRASSPVKICIRKMCQEESFYQLCRDLSAHFSNSSTLPVVRHWHAGAGCVVRLQGEGWVRARVLKDEVEGLAEVFLVDYGVQEVVGVDSIRTLPDTFTMAPFCWTVHMVKLIPAGGAKKWTVVACEKLRELFMRTGMVVEIQVVGDIVEGSWPVEVFVQEKDESAGPLDPDGFISKSVGDILKDEGLAIQPKDGSVTLTKRNSADGEHIDHDNPLSVSAGTETCISEDLLKEHNIDNVVLETFGGSNKFQWVEADLPSCSELTCSVSHVDWDCKLYISSIPGNWDTLRIIQSVLLSKYSGSSHNQDDLQWAAGEACIAQFHLDKRWYRGVVLKVLETGECLVKFVDYGSEERVKPVNMRKILFCTEVPIQCFTVQMDNVRPITEQWTEDVLDFLHKTVVDQELRVSIIQMKDTFPLAVTLSTKSGLDIGKMLVRNGYAREGESIVGVQ